MTAWWSAESAQYLSPDVLVIGLGGAFCPILRGSGSREGIWYLTETFARPWQPEDEQLLHLIRPDFASFAQALGRCLWVVPDWPKVAQMVSGH